MAPVHMRGNRSYMRVLAPHEQVRPQSPPVLNSQSISVRSRLYVLLVKTGLNVVY